MWSLVHFASNDCKFGECSLERCGLGRKRDRGWLWKNELRQDELGWCIAFDGWLLGIEDVRAYIKRS